MKIVVFLILLLPFITNALDWTPYFEPVSLNAKATGLGYSNISTSDGLSSIYFNPANLSKISKKKMSITIGCYDEERGWLKDEYFTKGARERHFYLSSFLVLFPLNEKIKLGIGYFLPYYVNLNIVDKYSETELYTRLDVITTSIGLKISSSLSIGGSVNLVREKNFYSFVIDTFWYPEGYIEYDKIEGTGLGATIGLYFQPSPTVSFGVFCQSPVFVKWNGVLKYRENEEKIKGQDKIPEVVGIGESVKLTKNITLYGTYLKKTWSKFKRTEENNKVDGSFRDDNVYYNFGVEVRIFKQNIPLRIGISYSPEDGDFIWEDRRILSIGTAYPFKFFTIDLSLQYDFRPGGCGCDYKKFNLITSVSYK